MATARELILSAMDRHAVTWADVQARVERDEELSAVTAEKFVRHAQTSEMPLIVAAAIITLIADKRGMA